MGGLKRTYTFSLEISLPDDLEIESERLQERIIEAIFAYDAANRLFGGRRRRKGESILGISVGMDKVEVETDSNSQPIDEDRLKRECPFLEQGEAERGRVLDISTKIGHRIEQFESVRANLWMAYNDSILAKDGRTFKAAQRKMTRLTHQYAHLAPLEGVKPSAMKH